MDYLEMGSVLGFGTSTVAVAVAVAVGLVMVCVSGRRIFSGWVGVVC